MKKSVLLLTFTLITCQIITAQVAINTDGSLPDSSAMLEIKSSNKGFLIPRMSDSLINNITSPATGLMIYSTNQQLIVYFDGEVWRNCNGTVLTNEFPIDALFVSPNGVDDTLNGTQNNPLLTISFAIDRAFLTGSSNIIVANGIYNETCEMKNGINIFGGYDASTWKRNLNTTQTIIRGTEKIEGHSVTIISRNIIDSTILEGFVIYGINDNIPGKNSYAIYVDNPSNLLQIKNNVIFSGNGAPQQDGTFGSNGLDGVNGAGRDTNPTGYDAFLTPSAPCTGANDRQYNNGGILFIGNDNVSGGNGGGNQCSPIFDTETSGTDGFNGESGDGSSGGMGGVGGDAGDDGKTNGSNCYIPSNPSIGSDGANGGDGNDGISGSGSTVSTGFLYLDHWIAYSGSDGSDGGNGGGAGGGGAGGGGECESGCTGDKLGGHGGGGGSGAGGGTGGQGGLGGGGSFGIFIINGSAPEIINNTIYLGIGGNGGNGGNGGSGGVGGSGGAGGICPDGCFCYGDAGAGGDGGNGGNGGAGGGGAGGNAYGIYTNNVSSTPNYGLTNNFFGGVAGTGGKGGYSNAGSATDGVSGVVMNIGNY